MGVARPSVGRSGHRLDENNGVAAMHQRLMKRQGVEGRGDGDFSMCPD
jgi:hypothetical protein